jgi:hypothetical protein
MIRVKLKVLNTRFLGANKCIIYCFFFITFSLLLDKYFHKYKKIQIFSKNTKNIIFMWSRTVKIPKTHKIVFFPNSNWTYHGKMDLYHTTMDTCLWDFDRLKEHIVPRWTCIIPRWTSVFEILIVWKSTSYHNGPISWHDDLFVVQWLYTCTDSSHFPSKNHTVNLPNFLLNYKNTLNS